MPEPLASPALPADLVGEIESLHSASFGWALACCRRDREAALDALQAAYCKVLSRQVRFDGRSSVKTWLFGVVRMTALEQRRWGWARRLLGQRRELVPAPKAQDEEAAERQDAARLAQAFAGLAARQREVLHLVFYEGLSVSEAAEVMGVAVGSARQHYDRGKKNLAEALRLVGVER